MNYQNNKSKQDFTIGMANLVAKWPYDIMGEFLDNASKYTRLRAEKENNKTLLTLADTLNEAHFSIMYADKLNKDQRTPFPDIKRGDLEHYNTADMSARLLTFSDVEDIINFKNDLADLLYNQVKSEIYKSKDRKNNLALKIYEAVEILDRTTDVEYLD